MNRLLASSLLPAAPWWRPRAGRTLVIRGGRPLRGTYPVSGAKNAVLPLMVSALLTPHLVTLHNVPASLDVAVLSALLGRLEGPLHGPPRFGDQALNAAKLLSTLSTRHRPEPRQQNGRADQCGAGAGSNPLPTLPSQKNSASQRGQRPQSEKHADHVAGFEQSRESLGMQRFHGAANFLVDSVNLLNRMFDVAALAAGARGRGHGSRIPTEGFQQGFNRGKVAPLPAHLHDFYGVVFEDRQFVIALLEQFAGFLKSFARLAAPRFIERLRLPS